MGGKEAMISAAEGVNIVINDWLKVKLGESVLIVADDKHIGEAVLLRDCAKKMVPMHKSLLYRKIVFRMVRSLSRRTTENCFETVILLLAVQLILLLPQRQYIVQ